MEDIWIAINTLLVSLSRQDKSGNPYSILTKRLNYYYTITYNLRRKNLLGELEVYDFYLLFITSLISSSAFFHSCVIVLVYFQLISFNTIPILKQMK